MERLQDRNEIARVSVRFRRAEIDFVLGENGIGSVSFGSPSFRYCVQGILFAPVWLSIVNDAESDWDN